MTLLKKEQKEWDSIYYKSRKYNIPVKRNGANVVFDKDTYAQLGTGNPTMIIDAKIRLIDKDNFRKGNIKFRRVGLNENINPNLSLTYKRNDVFNVFNESTGHEIGDFSRTRLARNFTRDQLDYVKGHGTTNFVKVNK